MDVSISKQNLVNSTNHVLGAVNERSMAFIGLKANDGTLTLCGHDRVMTSFSSSDCDVHQEGFCFVPSRYIAGVVKELPNEGEARLAIQDSKLVVSAGNGSEFEMKIPLVSDLSWPKSENFESPNKSSVNSNDLSYVINQVLFCITDESSRTYGTVGFLHRLEDEIRLVGTDGFRLSYSGFKSEAMAGEFLLDGVCISRRALHEIQKMCGEGHERVELAICEDQRILLLEVPNHKLYIRLSAVKYPNYEAVLPRKVDTTVDFARNHLQSVLKRVMLASDKSNTLQLDFTPSRLTLSSRKVGESEGKEDIDIENISPDDQKLFINGKYLLDISSTTASDRVSIQFRDNDTPVVIEPKTEPDGCISKHVLVPIRESH